MDRTRRAGGFLLDGQMILRRSRVLSSLSIDYEKLKEMVRYDAKATDVGRHFIQLTAKALDFLSASSTQIALVSKVPGKKYFSFSIDKGKKLSRAVNQALFDPRLKHRLNYLEEGLAELPVPERARFLYTVAMAYCCASDLLKTRDQKTPATFFECLIAHLLARSFGANPKTQIEVLHLEEEEASMLPTDFIFDLGQGKPKYHVPVKTSTRERVIQVFAHQRVLDGVHGFGTYKGMLICLTETKLDHENREVIEICVPKQWVLYYKFIAAMHRVYYFDVPARYSELARGTPPIPIASFSGFFDEVKDLAASH